MSKIQAIPCLSLEIRQVNYNFIPYYTLFNRRLPRPSDASPKVSRGIHPLTLEELKFCQRPKNVERFQRFGSSSSRCFRGGHNKAFHSVLPSNRPLALFNINNIDLHFQSSKNIFPKRHSSGGGYYLPNGKCNICY